MWMTAMLAFKVEKTTNLRFDYCYGSQIRAPKTVPCSLHAIINVNA